MSDYFFSLHILCFMYWPTVIADSGKELRRMKVVLATLADEENQ
jgi:hypothetical protein